MNRNRIPLSVKGKAVKMSRLWKRFRLPLLLAGISGLLGLGLSLALAKAGGG